MIESRGRIGQLELDNKSKEKNLEAATQKVKELENEAK